MTATERPNTMTHRKAFSVLTFIWLLLLTGASAISQDVFKVGTARRDITPTSPVPMWGYGDRHDTLSTGIIDPLYADALVIQTGDTKLAIVGLDLGRSPNEKSLQKIRERIKREAGIDYSFIAGSHTHHGPVLELSDEDGKGKGRFDNLIRYYTDLEKGISDAIIEANAHLTTARLSTGIFDIPGYNRNRHTKFDPKPVDTNLRLMRFDDPSGKLLAVLVNYTAHPTSIHSETVKFSADYVGALKRRIEKETGAFAIFMQGAAGDQSTNRRNGQDYQTYGAALADEVIKHLSEAKPHLQSSLVVKEDRFTFGSRTDFKNPTVQNLFAKAFFPELIPNFVDEYAQGVRPRLTVALLNQDIAIVGASGEFFANHAIRFRERLRGSEMFFFGYCNGYHQYFPTIEAVSEGGYGADNTVSPVEIGAGEKLMNTALLWSYQLMGKIKR
jgi:neutral ceramidase